MNKILSLILILVLASGFVSAFNSNSTDTSSYNLEFVGMSVPNEIIGVFMGGATQLLKDTNSKILFSGIYSDNCFDKIEPNGPKAQFYISEIYNNQWHVDGYAMHKGDSYNYTNKSGKTMTISLTRFKVPYVTSNYNLITKFFSDKTNLIGVHFCTIDDKQNYFSGNSPLKQFLEGDGKFYSDTIVGTPIFYKPTLARAILKITELN